VLQNVGGKKVTKEKTLRRKMGKRAVKRKMKARA